MESIIIVAGSAAALSIIILFALYRGWFKGWKHLSAADPMCKTETTAVSSLPHADPQTTSEVTQSEVAVKQEVEAFIASPNTATVEERPHKPQQKTEEAQSKTKRRARRSSSSSRKRRKTKSSVENS